MSNARRTLACWMALLVLAGCAGDDRPRRGSGDARTGASTPTVSPASTSVPTPSLPPPVSSADAPSVALAKVQTARLTLDAPDWLEVTAQALWVKLDGGTIVRVDPAAARVAKRINSSGPDEKMLCQGFGTSGDAVWTCTPFGSIERIDASTSRVTDRLLIRMRADQGKLAVASGRLWMITRASNSIAGIDLVDKSVGDPIQLGVSCTELAAADPIVWATCPAENQVVRIDTTTREVTGRFALPQPRQVAVGDDLWVGFEGGVAQVDLDTLSVKALFDVRPNLGGSIYADSDQIWVRCDGGPFLVGIDPVARRVIAKVTAEDLPSGGNVIRVGGQLWATAYDDAALVRLRPPAT